MNTFTAGTALHRPVPAFLTYGFRPFFRTGGKRSSPERVGCDRNGRSALTLRCLEGGQSELPAFG